MLGLDNSRGRRSISLLLFAFATTFANAQDDAQPYQVYVDQEGVTARCGPGGQYYRTDPLRHGQALEVYVETADGWLGIRPPDDSFCWLPADVVKLSPRQDHGVVTDDNALAWIGTHLGKANKYLWQVQLSEGEEVVILGRAKREGPDGVKLWYRIVPPAGEFRWVHSDQVVANPEMLLRDIRRNGSPLASGTPTLAEQEPEFVDAAPPTRSKPITERYTGDDYADNEPREALPLPVPMPLPAPRPMRDEVAQSDWQQPIVGSGVNQMAVTTQTIEQPVARAYEAPLIAFTTRPVVQSIGGPASGSQSPAPVQPVGALADSFSQRSDSRSQLAVIPATLQTPVQPQAAVQTRDSVDQSRVVIHPASLNVPHQTAAAPKSLDGLQLELSRLMSRSAHAGEVQSVLASAMQISNSSLDQNERSRASMIAQRAEQYQGIAQRRDGVVVASFPTVSMTSTTFGPAMTLPAAPAQSPSPTPMSAEVSPTDSAGFLVQVFSARPDSPPFALTDKQGRTAYYVSPAPGVNIRRFLNQYISVRGTTGYTTGLDTPHIIATGAMRVAE